jgi:hypothetical protein
MESIKFGKRGILPALVLGSALLLGVFGCEKGNSNVGKYQYEKNPQDFTELKKDGTCLIRQGQGTFTGKYEINGKALKLTLNTGDVVSGSIDGKTITDNEGQHWVKQ